MPFIVRDDGTVIEAQTLDMDFNSGLSVGLLAPGVVVINIPALGITNAMLAADSVDGSKIVANTITNTDINAAAAILFSKLEAVPGMVRTASQSFSAVASVSVNNCFSATYEHYRILLNITPSVSAGTIRLRLRVGGADNSSGNYQRNTHIGTSAAVHTPNVNASLTGTEFFLLSNGTLSVPSLVTADVLNPFATAETMLAATGVDIASAASIVAEKTGGKFALTTSFDGFSLIPSSGTISGKVAVYGYS